MKSSLLRDSIAPKCKKIILAMKLTIILLTAGFLQVSAKGIAQNVSLSGKNVKLETVFSQIEKQTGYSFFYSDKDLEKVGPVTIDIQNKPLEEALKEILANQPLDFIIKGNTVFVKGKVLGIGVPPIDVHGRVTDSLGNPIQGASITVRGTRKGIQTDANGNFTLKGIAPNSTIIVSIVGYEEQQIKLEDRNDLVVVLRQGATELKDVVISKGYYNTTERLNTGNVSIVTSKEIEEQPLTDPILALQGRVPGLYIQQASGVPGANSIVRIRGQNSIFNGNNPLYLVDGVPYNSASPTNTDIGGGVLGNPFSGDGVGASPFNNLNPADIESIEVLKDADATAIYGSRGANGVILITTKKGKSGTTKFDINAFTGSGEVSHYLDLMNTQQYLQMRHEALNNDGLTPNPAYDYDLTFWDTTRYTNWQKVLIGNPAKFSNLQGTLSGGNTNTQFRISGGYSNQGTVYPGSYSDQKAMASINLTHSSLNRRFHAQLTANYVYDYSNLPSVDFASDVTIAPDAPALYNADGSLNWAPLNGGATFGNPLAITLIKSVAKTDNLVSNLDLSYLILPGLQLKSSFGFTHAQNNQNILTPASSQAPPNNTLPENRSNLFATTDSRSWIIEPQLSYERTISKGKLNILLGSTFQQNLSDASAFNSSGYASDALIQDPSAAEHVNLSGYHNTLYHYDAIFGRLSYNWEDKYLANATARRDGSSRFGPDKHFGNFGAIGAGWIFSHESFIQNSLPLLSFGKLRASYGTTGNDQIGDYQYLSTYTPNSFTYQGVTGLYPTGLTNPNFAWEVVKKLEGAIELGFLKDCILLSASFYRDRDGNQLLRYPLPQLVGFGNVIANSPATVQNTGVELTLNTVNIKSRSFTWSTSFNLTIPQNKLIAFPNLAASPYANTYEIGKSIFIQNLYHAGVNDSTGQFEYASSKGGFTSNPSYPQDLRFTEPITQHWYGGIGNSFSYKGFELDFLIQFVSQSGFNYDRNLYLAGIDGVNVPTAYLNRWQKPGDIAKYGRYSTEFAADPSFSIASSDLALCNTSFVRLKNLAISYQFPKQWLGKINVQNLRLYVQCQNLFTITHNYLGYDPETGATGLPPLRVITGGLQINL
jgi:TonB-dependent starch-binding outer membrane protein SusC